MAILLGWSAGALNGQQAFVAEGGEATGPGGTMSHSSGQTDYLYFSSEAGSMQMGVQQVFDYFLLFTWTGNQSTAWLLAANWSFNRTPEEIEETITIPSGRPHYPILNVLQEVVDLSIEPGATLTIAPDGRLTVTGNLLNKGGNQGLLIRSTADSTGSLLHVNAGVPARVQRHISGLDWAWHQLSSPVAAQSISPAFSDGNVFAWHEPAQTWVSFANNMAWPTWNDVNDEHDHFIPARGYMTAYVDNPTKLFEGMLNQGTQAFSLQRQAHPDDTYEGFNLMGNPYPSSIDWKAASGWMGRENLVETGGGYSFWVWNDATGNYGAYNSSMLEDQGTHGVTRHIAPMQAFWVRANASAELGLDDPLRLHSDQAWLKQRESIPGVLRLAVTGDANPWRDELMLEFDHPSGHGGAEKMFSLYPEAPSLYSLKEETPHSISFHEQATEHTIVRLGFTPGADGLFAITAEGADHFQKIYLVDRQLGFYHDLRLAGSYQFTAGTGDDPLRFEIRFSPAGTTGINEGATGLNVHIYTYRQTLYINLSQETGRKILELYDLNGRLFVKRELPEGLHFSQLLHVPDGVYLVRLTTGSGVHWQKVFVR